ALSQSRAVLPALAAIHLIVSWPTVLPLYAAQHAWALERIPLEAAFRRIDEDTYLNEWHGGYQYARMVELAVPPREGVFSFGGLPESYCAREIVVAYQSAFGNKLGDILWAGMWQDYPPPGRKDFMPLGRTRYRFAPQALRAIRLIQTGSEPIREWNVT